MKVRSIVTRSVVETYTLAASFFSVDLWVLSVLARWMKVTASPLTFEVVPTSPAGTPRPSEALSKSVALSRTHQSARARMALDRRLYTKKTRTGRVVWLRVLENYVSFLATCFGTWSDRSSRFFKHDPEIIGDYDRLDLRDRHTSMLQSRCPKSSAAAYRQVDSDRQLF